MSQECEQLIDLCIQIGTLVMQHLTKHIQLLSLYDRMKYLVSKCLASMEAERTKILVNSSQTDRQVTDYTRGN